MSLVTTQLDGAAVAGYSMPQWGHVIYQVGPASTGNTVCRVFLCQEAHGAVLYWETVAVLRQGAHVTLQEADEQQKQQLAALAAAYGQPGAQAAFPGMMHGPIVVPHLGQAASPGTTPQQQANGVAQMWIAGAPIAYGQPGQVCAVHA